MENKLKIGKSDKPKKYKAILPNGKVVDFGDNLISTV